MFENAEEPHRGWRRSAAALMAAIGTALGIASLFGDWSTAVRNGTPVRSWNAVELGCFGIPYIVALTATLAFTADTLFRQASKRTAGLVTSTSAILLLSCMAKGLSHPGGLLDVTSSGAPLPHTLEWGIYAAFGALAALAAALILHPKTNNSEEPTAT